MKCARECCRAEFEPRRGGKPQAYCSKSCRALASQARIKARDPEAFADRHARESRRYRASIKALPRIPA